MPPAAPAERGSLARAPRGELRNLQALRGIAVLLVVFVHWRNLEHAFRSDAMLPDWARIGHSGVDLFFVISGFIMVLVAPRYPTGPRGSVAFLYHRWARIYPTYWLWFGLALLVYLTAPALLRWQPGQFQDLLGSFWLVPTGTPQLIAVNWTLKYELYFYLVFGLIIMAPGAWRWQLLTLWGLAMWVGQRQCYDAPEVLCHKSMVLLMHPLNTEFLLGSLVAVLYGRFRNPIPGLTLLLGVALLVAGWLTYLLTDIRLEADIWNRVLLFGGPAAVLLYGAVELERARSHVAPTWLHAIGNASYSIYLSHLPLMTAAFGLLAAAGGLPTALVSAVVLTIGLGCGLLGYRWLERPLIAVTRKVVQQKQ